MNGGHAKAIYTSKLEWKPAPITLDSGVRHVLMKHESTVDLELPVSIVPQESRPRQPIEISEDSLPRQQFNFIQNTKGDSQSDRLTGSRKESCQPVTKNVNREIENLPDGLVAAEERNGQQGLAFEPIEKNRPNNRVVQKTDQSGEIDNQPSQNTKDKKVMPSHILLADASHGKEEHKSMKTHNPATNQQSNIKERQAKSIRGTARGSQSGNGTRTPKRNVTPTSNKTAGRTRAMTKNEVNSNLNSNNSKNKTAIKPYKTTQRDSSALTNYTAKRPIVKPEDDNNMSDRNLLWLEAMGVANDTDDSDDEPRQAMPTPFTRRDSTDLLIQEAKQACILQSMATYSYQAEHSHSTDTISDDITECSDTYSDESRSTCSTFDLSEQTDDSEPRLVIPKLYDKLDRIEILSAYEKRTTPEGVADHYSMAGDEMGEYSAPVTRRKVPSSIQGRSERYPKLVTSFD